MAYYPEIAMVFAAGFGKRLAPLTQKTPKPLVEVAGKTLIARVFDRLEEAGVCKVVVNTHYKADQMREYLDSQDRSFEIIILHETEILETGGGVVNALSYLGDKPCYCINSDVIWFDFGCTALSSLAEKWDDSKMDSLMLVHDKQKAIGYYGSGDFNLAQNMQIDTNIALEKKYVFTGIQILNPMIFSQEKVEPFSLYRDFLFPRYVDKNSLLSRVYGSVHEGDWLHVGDLAGVRLAENYICKISVDFVEKSL